MERTPKNGDTTKAETHRTTHSTQTSHFPAGFRRTLNFRPRPQRFSRLLRLYFQANRFFTIRVDFLRPAPKCVLFFTQPPTPP